MTESSSDSWYEELVVLLERAGRTDEEVVEFIEDNVPSDEAHIFDCKLEDYISASDEAREKTRRAEMAERFAALANVSHPSSHRFVFVGFDDTVQFEGVEYRGAKGGISVYDADDKKIQNILRDHLDPEPAVEKHRLDSPEGKAVVFTVEKVDSPPVVISKTVTADGNRVVTEGIAPTRRSSETTRMSHSDFRDIVEHRENLLSETLEQFADDLGKVIQTPTDELASLEIRASQDPSLPAVQEFVLPKEARNIEEDLSAKTKSWLTDQDLPGSPEPVYKFYHRRNDISRESEERDRAQLEFLFQASVAHYLPGTEWLFHYTGDLNGLFGETLEVHHNYRAILMLEKILLVLQREDLLKTVASDSDYEYADSKAGVYATLVDQDIEERVIEYVGERTTVDGQKYRTRDLFNDSELTGDLFDDVTSRCFGASNPPKSELRNLEMIRLGQFYDSGDI